MFDIKRKKSIFLLAILMCSLSTLIMNLPKAKGEYDSDYEYPVYVGDFFVYRKSDPDYGLVYEEYEIISKIEGYPYNYSIHAAYENYTIDTQIGDSLDNLTVTHLFSLYGDIKEGGYYDNSADWNTETIEIMGASVECWIF